MKFDFLKKTTFIYKLHFLIGGFIFENWKFTDTNLKFDFLERATLFTWFCIKITSFLRGFSFQRNSTIPIRKSSSTRKYLQLGFILYKTTSYPVTRHCVHFNSCSTSQTKNVTVLNRTQEKSICLIDRRLIVAACVEIVLTKRPCCASLRIHDTVSGTVCVPVSHRGGGGGGGSCNNFGKAAAARPIFAQTYAHIHVCT